MTEPPRESYTVEGELVRDVWDYEYDDLTIGGHDLKEWIRGMLGPGREEVTSHTTRKTHHGRVRLTIEVLADD